MNISARDLSLVLEEFKGAIEGAFLDKATQTAEWEWVFLLRKGGQKNLLLISLSAQNSRTHLLSSMPEERANQGHFTGILKKTISRGFLYSVERPGRDRILKLNFNTHSGDYHLVAELMGGRANAYLLDATGKIIATALSKKSRAGIGEIYSPPPPMEESAVRGNQPAIIAGTEKLPGKKFPFNVALETICKEPAEKEKLESARKEEISPLKDELKKATRLMTALERERTELEKHKGDKRLGDILQANFHLLKRGIPSVTVTDVFSENEAQIEILLNPALDPAENMALYYKRYRRREKGLARIAERLAETEKSLEKINDSIKKIESPTWRPIEKTGESAVKRPRSIASKSKSQKQQKENGPRRFISSEGHVILVGRSDRENDELTFRTANGRDLWLHARDYPGSHVVAKLPKGIELPQKTLREAAMLAIHYSKAAKSGKGEVTWLYAKDVKKPKGAPPGKVIVTGAKSVSVRVDEDLIREMKEKGEKS